MANLTIAGLRKKAYDHKATVTLTDATGAVKVKTEGLIDFSKKSLLSHFKATTEFKVSFPDVAPDGREIKDNAKAKGKDVAAAAENCWNGQTETVAEAS